MYIYVYMYVYIYICIYIYAYINVCVYYICIHIYSYHFEEQKLDTWGRARFKALLKEKVSLSLFRSLSLSIGAYIYLFQ
jgi:hypothetical protein